MSIILFTNSNVVMSFIIIILKLSSTRKLRYPNNNSLQIVSSTKNTADFAVCSIFSSMNLHTAWQAPYMAYLAINITDSPKLLQSSFLLRKKKSEKEKVLLEIIMYWATIIKLFSFYLNQRRSLSYFPEEINLKFCSHWQDINNGEVLILKSSNSSNSVDFSFTLLLFPAFKYLGLRLRE